MELIVCPNCGEENPAKFRLCGFCGTALAPALPPQELRKTVTIVFSDLKGSTNLGEALDPESLREVMSRYFDAMTAVLELHGGTIEKYIGDAIMAVFGLPGCTRTTRSARFAPRMACRQRARELNDELGKVRRPSSRTGPASTPARSSPGDVTTGPAPRDRRRSEHRGAARTGRARQRGAHRRATYGLVRGQVDVEAVEPLELKGKAERVAAYRLGRGRRERDAPTASEPPARRA